MATQQTPEPRRAMRPDMRDDDPRARAAARAAQIDENIDFDEAPDEFFIPAEDIPDGWTYEWKRRTVFGKADPGNDIALARHGWENVPAARHPTFMPRGYTGADIERNGMVLMERPETVTEKSRGADHRRARALMHQKEEQLGQAPPGTFERSNKADSMVNIRKSRGPVEIPAE